MMEIWKERASVFVSINVSQQQRTIDAVSSEALPVALYELREHDDRNLFRGSALAFDIWCINFVRNNARRSIV